MLFKVDENLTTAVVERLRQANHDAMSVLDQNLGGEGDPRVAQVCRNEGRAIITLDLDFSDIRNYPPKDYAGIIVLRPTVSSVANLVRLIDRLIPLFDREPISGRLWIVDESNIRIRGEEADTFDQPTS